MAEINWIRDVDDPRCIGKSLAEAKYYRTHKSHAYSQGMQEFMDTAIPCEIDGTVWRVHPNVNLYLDSTDRCNCDCHFCIAKVNFGRHRTAGSDEYVAAITRAAKTLASTHPSIQLTGGEPTLNTERFIRICEAIRESGLRVPVLNTNGVNVKRMISTINTTFQHLNISLHHYNEADSRSLGFLPADLRDLGDMSTANIRVQCNMIGDYIDTYGEVMQMIAYAYHHIGARSIAFAQLTPLPIGDYYQNAVIQYVVEHPVDVDSILRHIEDDHRFVFEKYRGGVACYYEIYKFQAYDEPMTVCFKYSDNSYLSWIDDQAEYCPDFVLHTDATLCGSWNRNKKRIWRS